MTDELSNALDLFEADKRLSLKSVIEFNLLLRKAFGIGPCRCKRCEDGGRVESNYEHQHTFNLDGIAVNRRFAGTTSGDVMQALKKVWLSYFKVELTEHGAVNLPSIYEFVEPSLLNRVRPLLMASRVAVEADDQLKYQRIEE